MPRPHSCRNLLGIAGGSAVRWIQAEKTEAAGVISTDRSWPNQTLQESDMVDSNLTLSPSSPQPTNALRTEERLRLLEREQNDQMFAGIARRMATAERRPPITEAPRMAVLNAMGDALLSPRLEQVVALVGDGMTNAEIAREMNITQHTAKKYLVRIFDKLGVSTRVELALYAAHNGQRRAAPTPNAGLMERAATLLNELLGDNRLDAGQTAAAKDLHEQIMAAFNIKKPVASVAENGTLRAQGHGHRERRHTKTFLQPLGLPVWKDGKKMLCAVVQHFVLSNPRENEKLVWWFETVELARQNFPEARLLALPDYKPGVPVLVPQVQQVAPRLAAPQSKGGRA
jgi:DNA-binding NarL/FixJ family response regulator